MKTTAEAVQLLFEGQIALAQIESSGVRVDQTYLNYMLKESEETIKELEAGLQSDPVWNEWKKAHGDKANIRSRTQLADVVFDKMGYASVGKTRTGRAKADKMSLETVNIPFVKDYLRLENLKGDRKKYLEGVQREMVQHDDGMYYFHPSFNLNTAKSMRSSSGTNKAESNAGRELNWQSLPARDSERAELVRNLFIPRPGNHFVECDYGQIEIGVPAAITGDKELRRYFTDPTTDMHRDQSRLIFKLKEVPKKVRSQVKNQFVFASFYGSAWYNCAAKLWDDIDRLELETAEGLPLKEHLLSVGIKGLGFTLEQSDDRDRTTFKGEPAPNSFGAHVRACQDKLWQRFQGYKDWKEKVWNQYREQGWIKIATGFVIGGLYTRNEITNTPIQGPAFHCLLWSLIQLVKLMKKYKMKSLLLGEIHDSTQMDVPPKEINSVLDLVNTVMIDDLQKAWKWLDNIGLKVECEVADVDQSWFHKRVWTRKESGLWSLKG